MRFEMELERLKQMHQKELEDKDEELEDVHKSSQRRVSRGLRQGNSPKDLFPTGDSSPEYSICFVCLCVCVSS